MPLFQVCPGHLLQLAILPCWRASKHGDGNENDRRIPISVGNVSAMATLVAHFTLRLIFGCKSYYRPDLPAFTTFAVRVLA
jgi:hypothetical protein